MIASLNKPIIIGILFIITLASGFAVSHGGKPYNTGLFTIHKLAALAAIILTALTVKQLWSSNDVQATLEMVLAITSGLLFLVLFVTGAILSIKSQSPIPVLRVHQITPLISAAVSVIVVYLLVTKKA